jgi:hypothetical protein
MPSDAVAVGPAPGQSGSQATMRRVRGAPSEAEDEERLVARARTGDQDAFAGLAGRDGDRLRRTLFRITRDCEAAQDAVQEALTRAWLNIERFEGRSRFFTWLTRIGINEACNRLPRHTTETLDADDGVGTRVAGWGDQPDRIFESRGSCTRSMTPSAGCHSTTAPRSRCATSRVSSPPRRPKCSASASGRSRVACTADAWRCARNSTTTSSTVRRGVALGGPHARDGRATPSPHRVAGRRRGPLPSAAMPPPGGGAPATGSTRRWRARRPEPAPP